MGIQLKLLFSDSKDQLNVVVEDYDRTAKKVVRTMLDVMVDLESKQKNISDIDDCSNDDLDSNMWNIGDNELEKVLGEDLGIEISNITGNAPLFKVLSSNDKSESAVDAVVSMAEKCTLSDKDEEEILNADFTNINISKNGTNPVDINLVRNECDGGMVLATESDEDAILSMSDTLENKKSEKTQNNSVITDNRSKNEDQSVAAASSGNENQSALSPSLEQKQPSTSSTSETSEQPSTPSTSGTLKRKDYRENSKSPKKVVPAKSNSADGGRNSQSEDECEFVIEEILDFDSLEEIESDSDIQVLDLTDSENIDPRCGRTHNVPSTDAESCFGSDGVITVINNYSDDEDEVCSQYSSARSSDRRRDLIETVYDDDDCDEIQVVDLTAENTAVECVDLTSDRKCGAAAISYPVVIRRSSSEVMNDLRNFYSSNKNMIAARKDALRALSQWTDKKKSGIEAPPKLSNGLPYRKRCSPITHESEIKFSRTTRSSGLRERNGNAADESSRDVAPFNREVPKPTCGPPGFRLNDDFGEPEPVEPKEEECAARDWRFSDPGSSFSRRPSREFNFRRNRRGGRSQFHLRAQGKRFFKRFSQNHVSPLRRQIGARKAPRTIHPTHFRGEVWLDLK